MINDDIKNILKGSKTIAVVGLSDKEGRPSLKVASYLKMEGYTIIPVNPGLKEVLGERSFPDLASIPQKVDIVDIFRKPEEVLHIVKDAIHISAPVIWMQEGIINEEAAHIAAEAGLKVVMDRCMLKEHLKLK